MKATKSAVRDVAGEVRTIGAQFERLFNSSQAVHLWGMQPFGDTSTFEIHLWVTRLRVELGTMRPGELPDPRVDFLGSIEPSACQVRDGVPAPKTAREFQALVTQICKRLEDIVRDPKAIKALRKVRRNDPDVSCQIHGALFTIARYTCSRPGALYW